MSKFASMSDFRKQQDKDKDDDVKPGEKKGKESFVGGGASGLNVVDRGSGKPADLVDRIVSKTGDAREGECRTGQSKPAAQRLGG